MGKYTERAVIPAEKFEKAPEWAKGYSPGLRKPGRDDATLGKNGATGIETKRVSKFWRINHVH